MTQDNYSIKDVIEEFRRDTKESLDRIEAQTMKTNGRVTASEREISSLKTSRAQLWTAIAIFTFLGSTIVALAIMAIDSKIREGIDTALSTKYDINDFND